MPLMPNLVERTLFFTLNQGPGPSLDLWSGPAFRIVLAAIRLDLFEALARRPATSEQLAQDLGTDARGTALLLEALAALGYVQARDAAYGLTAMARKWLTRGGAVNLTPFYRYWGVIVEEFFPRLEDSLRTGVPPVNLYAWLEDHPDVARDFQEGMVALTRYVQADVLNKIALPPDARHLLDVGGGHAAYSIALCQKYTRLEAVVLDTPQALAAGAAGIAAAGLSARITPLSGDFFADDLGTGYDAVLLFNIVHGLTAQQNVDLLYKVRAALNPGGVVYLLEQVPGSTPLPLSGAAARILGLSYFHLLGGQTYSFAEIERWLQVAGFGAVQRASIPKAASALITGTLPLR